MTGEQIPDETARVPVVRYVNPRKAEWPEADFVVGNPPFIGNKRMRHALGDGYVEALRTAHDDVPETADFVMYWWNKAAERVRSGADAAVRPHHDEQHHADVQPARSCSGTSTRARRFASSSRSRITRGSTSADGAAVRVAMTVGEPGRRARAALRSVARGDRRERRR